MLWRESYETQVIRGFEPPGPILGTSLTDEVLHEWEWKVFLIGSGAASLGRQEMWRRLVEADFGESVRVAQLVADVDVGERLDELVPRSRRAKTFKVELSGWPMPEDVAAWCPPAGLLMIGQPTESAWDEFSGAVRGYEPPDL